MLGSGTCPLMTSYFGTKSGIEPPPKCQVIFEQVLGWRGRCDRRLRVMCRTGVKRRGLDRATLIATQYGAWAR
jgi:hypothetical protein